MTWQTSSTSSKQTEQLGERLGRRLKGNEVIELLSDLGGGKTTFVRGLARGAGSKDVVASPTFTISKVYTARNFSIYHFDLYRLAEAGLTAYELQDALQDTAVTVVEWGGVAEGVLPRDRIKVHFVRQPDDSRLVKYEFPAKLKYLVEMP